MSTDCDGVTVCNHAVPRTEADLPTSGHVVRDHAGMTAAASAPRGRWFLRAATAGDVEPIADLRAVVLRPDLERLGRYVEHRVRQRLRDGFMAEHTWVIEAAGEFAGSVALRPAADGHWLEHFYIAPNRQGAGLGTAVLRDLLAQTERDRVRVRLNVLQGSAARRLYERHGFVVTSEDPVDVFMVREPGAG